MTSLFVERFVIHDAHINAIDSFGLLVKYSITYVVFIIIKNIIDTSEVIKRCQYLQSKGA